MSTEPKWKQYQERVAAFFRELGLSAKTDATIVGVRTTHDVDVLVESFYKSIAIKWVIECKLWKRRVTKLEVAALRTIVNDVGADRGFIMSESGYQKGALEASYRSNVDLTSLSDLRETCAYDLVMMRVRQLYFRALTCKERYWALDKEARIAHELRNETYLPVTYNGDWVAKSAERVLLAALFNGFPVTYDVWQEPLIGQNDGKLMELESNVVLTTPEELADFVGESLDELERRLRAAESAT